MIIFSGPGPLFFKSYNKHTLNRVNCRKRREMYVAVVSKMRHCIFTCCTTLARGEVLLKLLLLFLLLNFLDNVVIKIESKLLKIKLIQRSVCGLLYVIETSSQCYHQLRSGQHIVTMYPSLSSNFSCLHNDSLKGLRKHTEKKINMYLNYPFAFSRTTKSSGELDEL